MLTNDFEEPEVTGPIVRDDCVPSRRCLLGILGLAALSGPFVLGGLVRDAAAATDKAKVIFVLYRRSALTHEQSMAEWSGAQHMGIVRKVPGLQKWVQNQPSTAPAPGQSDGIGELWFSNADVMASAMNSPEMGAAVEDAKRFLDFDRSYALVVTERAIMG